MKYNTTNIRIDVACSSERNIHDTVVKEHMFRKLYTVGKHNSIIQQQGKEG